MAKIRKFYKPFLDGEASHLEIDTEPGDIVEIVHEDGTTIKIETPITLNSGVVIDKPAQPTLWYLPKRISDVIGKAEDIISLLEKLRSVKAILLLANDTVLLRLVEVSILFQQSVDADLPVVAKGDLTEEGEALVQRINIPD